MLAFARATKPRDGDRHAKSQKLAVAGKVLHAVPIPTDESDGSEEEGGEVRAAAHGERVVCNCCSGAARMLLCDGLGCKAATHLGCASPPLPAIPRGDWFCPECDPYFDVETAAPKGKAWLLSPTKPAPASVRAGWTGGRGKRATTEAYTAVTAQTHAADSGQRERGQLLRRLRAAARDLHYSSTPESLLCRTAELATVLEFVHSRLDGGGKAAAGGGLYISGTPGNGKTVTINRVREQLAREMRSGERPACPVVTLNAFAFVDTPTELYTAIEHELTAAASARGGARGAHARDATEVDAHDKGKASAQAALARLEARFAAAAAPAAPGRPGDKRGSRARGVPAKPAAKARAKPQPKAAAGLRAILIVDEIDALYKAAGDGRAAGGDDVLCRLFEWAALPQARLVVIGIANAIDLTDRMIPALARRGVTPRVLAFPPYAPADIVAILEERLGRAATGGAGGGAGALAPIVARAALEFCARKVCAASSDARRALDICRGALDVVLGKLEADIDEAEAGGAQPAAAAGGCSAPVEAAVSVAVMATAVSSLFTSRVVELCATLPQHQKFFMAAAVLHFRAADAAAVKARSAPPADGRLTLFGGPKRPTGPKQGPTTVRQLYEAYDKLCRQHSIKPISISDMVPACQALAASGMLQVCALGAAGRAPELDKHVSLAIAPEDLLLAVQEQAGGRFHVAESAPSLQCQLSHVH
ncbi:P-loop containing nucleoside triphosphate hydrolase protein [Pavlovales sp. CCMP2436]|nr:P-loop containing nucleoside triphosphate hydrolase protein [Pavlovales sp. CCMP2436]